MKYVQLRAFHNVAIHGGFSRAAQAMGLTQPAVSDQVLGLEQTYDILLFDRRKKQITLTPQGEALLAITRPMFEIEARALEYLSESRALTSGTLRIIADSAYHVTAVLSRFRARYPGVHITLRSGNSQAVEAELAAYRADIGVLGSSIAPGRFHSVSLGTTPIIAFAAKTFPGLPRGAATLHDLARLPLVFREQGSKTRQKLNAYAKTLGLTLSPAIEAEGREAVREIVAAGGGIGFVSDAEYGRDERLVKIPIRGAELAMQETVVCVRQRRDVRMIRAFMAMANPPD
jgi:LysR family transcriptional regulator, low CO2-responsive transcriptional regulator